MPFTTSDTMMMLKTSPDPKVSGMANDTGLVKSLTAIFNASLEMAEDPAMGLARKGVAVAGMAGSATESKALQAVSFAGTSFVETMGLAKLSTGTSPGKVGMVVGIAVANKVLAAADLAELDKCKVAAASLGASLAAGGMACFAGGAFTMGISCAIGAVAVAADALDAYGKCHGGSGQAKAAH